MADFKKIGKDVANKQKENAQKKVEDSIGIKKKDQEALMKEAKKAAEKKKAS